MRPAAAAITAFLSRRISDRMTVYSSQRNRTARALSANAGGNNSGNAGVSSDKYDGNMSGKHHTSPATQEQPQRAFSSSASPAAAAAAAAADASTSTSETLSSSRACSIRGTRAVELLPIYLTDARAVQRYCPDTCPDGALQLSVAENQMLEDLLVPALRGFASSTKRADGHMETFYNDMIYYQPTPGRPGLRRAMADYLRRILDLPGDMDSEGMVVGAGCNAVLENLCICLANPGEGVLIPTPYYAAFEFDLVARAGLDIIPVPTLEHHPELTIGNEGALPPVAYYPNRSSLDAAMGTARAAGTEPKILLLSHPNNPLGVCYPPSVMKECIDWGRENEIHVVSDEIYAGSVYRESATSTDDKTFESALSIASGHTNGEGLGIGSYVHLVYALSKDFCLSGLRVGAAYSENPDIRMPMQKLNDLCQISSQTQLLVERMLNAPSEADGDGYWSSDNFLPEARRRTRLRNEQLECCLDQLGIPHLTADSGMFVWMDMREFLPPRNDDGAAVESQESIDKRERELYLELLQKHGLLFTPGRSMKNELPGFFRCVFAAASNDEFNLGLERIEKFVEEKRGEGSDR